MSHQVILLGTTTDGVVGAVGAYETEDAAREAVHTKTVPDGNYIWSIITISAFGEIVELKGRHIQVMWPGVDFSPVQGRETS